MPIKVNEKQEKENQEKLAKFRKNMRVYIDLLLQKTFNQNSNKILSNKQFMAIYTQIHNINEQHRISIKLIDIIAQSIKQISLASSSLLLLQTALSDVFTKAVFLQGKLRLLIHWIAKLFMRVQANVENQTKLHLINYCFELLIKNFYSNNMQFFSKAFLWSLQRTLQGSSLSQDLHVFTSELIYSYDTNLKLSKHEQFYVIIPSGFQFSSKTPELDFLIDCFCQFFCRNCPKLSHPIDEFLQQSFLPYCQKYDGFQKIIFGQAVYRKQQILKKMNLMNLNILDQLINHSTGLRKLIVCQNWLSLKRFYKNQYDGKEKLVRAITAQIQSQGKELAKKVGLYQQQNQISKPKINSTVLAMLNFQKHFSRMVEAFQYDSHIAKAVETALQTVISDPKNFIHYLVVCLDIQILKEEPELKFIQELVNLFAYLYSRDAFMKLYYKYFANRLIQKLGKNRDIELNTLNLFKAKVGSSLINKLCIMIKDVDDSLLFQKSLKKPFMLEFSAIFLARGVWPFVSLELSSKQCPSEIRHLCQFYQESFQKVNPFKELSWAVELGSAVLRFRSSRGDYFLNCSTVIMIVLLQFNHRSQITIQDSVSLLKVSDEKIVKASLQYLIKLKILNLSGNNLSVNPDFQSKTTRINCIVISKIKEKESIGQELTRQRELIMDAALVKLMKSRKRMKVQELLGEAKGLIKMFKSENEQMQKRVQSLVERQFFMREGNQLTYRS